MALKTVDLTQQPHRAVFTGSSEEEINYAKRFWQSIQLLPPMESRLVSSDIKQRLRKAPPSRSVSNYTSRRTGSGESNLRDFFVRAKSIENIEEYRRLRDLASAREADRQLLHKHRSQRIKKEAISRRASIQSAGSTYPIPYSAMSGPLSSVSTQDNAPRDHSEYDEFLTPDMWATNMQEEISRFEKLKGIEDEKDSDTEK